MFFIFLSLYLLFLIRTCFKFFIVIDFNNVFSHPVLGLLPRHVPAIQVKFDQQKKAVTLNGLNIFYTG